MTPEVSNINWIIPTLFSLLASGLGVMVLLFMRGINADIQELTKRVEENAKEMRLSVTAQQTQLTQVRIEMAKMQEQLYSLLRGGRPMSLPVGGGEGT